MRLSIYLTPELYASVKACHGINISAVCQSALKAEVWHRRAEEHARALTEEGGRDG